jgi:hypothetical protein
VRVSEEFSMPDGHAVHDFDAGLRGIARALVAEAPAAAESLPALPVVVRPGGPSRRRAVAGAAASAVALVSLAGVLLVTTVRHTPSGTDQVRTAPPAQRRILEGWPGELRSDGALVPLPLGGLDRLGLSGPPQPLPGGRHLLLGVRDVPDRTQGETPGLVLTVVSADGSVEIDRDVPAAHESVSLIATTPTQAILARSPTDSLGRSTGPTSIVGHDITTGRERLIAKGNFGEFRADVAGDTLVVVEGSRADQLCRLELIDLASGHRSPHRLPMPCFEVQGVHASPGGALAAIAYDAIGRMPELRLDIVDLADSSIRSDELIGNNLSCPPAQCAGVRPVHYLGMAWDDNATIRIALIDLTADPDFNPEGAPITKDALILERHTVR